MQKGLAWGQVCGGEGFDFDPAADEQYSTIDPAAFERAEWSRWRQQRR